MPLLRRALGGISRRLGRPELLAAAYGDARRTLHEEIAMRAVLASALRSDGTYVDAGTNRGQVLAEAVQIAPRGRHVAFEPIPALAAEVARSFPDVECRQVALGATPGEAEFCHFTTMDGWSGLRRSPEVSDERGHPRYIRVRVSTLDEELEGLVPTVVKIDVEGAELDVLEGGRRVLGETKPHVIFEHVAAAAALYAAPPEGCWDLLSELDYEVFTLTGEGPFTRSQFAARAAGGVAVNWLARPQSSRAR